MDRLGDLLLIGNMKKQSPSLLILQLRLRQLWRVCKEVGWTNFILMSPFLVIVVLGMLEHLSTTTNVGSMLLIVFTLGGMHWKRKDRILLEQISPVLFPIFVIEYLLLLLPVWGSLVVFGQWLQCSILWVMIVLISLWKPAAIPTASAISRQNLYWIPRILFEWRTGLRTHFWKYSFSYLIAVIWSYQTIVVPIAVPIFALIVVSFFNDLENRDLLLAVNHDQRLLVKKVGQSLLLFHSLLLPLYGLFLYFHAQYWYVLLVLGMISSLLIAFAICIKYKSYRFEYQKVHNNLAISIFTACWLYPFFWPIPIIMLIVYWRQAQRNLIHHYA